LGRRRRPEIQDNYSLRGTFFLLAILQKSPAKAEESGVILLIEISRKQTRIDAVILPSVVVYVKHDVALNLYDFVVRRPGVPAEKYGLRAYDEVILAPMVGNPAQSQRRVTSNDSPG
jgi:hypothetical protein